VTQARRTHLVGCAWFWAWALVGAGAAFSTVSFAGTLTALPVALVALLMARQPSVRRSSFGVISGVGLLLVAVGWIQRSGEALDPLPWLALGLVLLLAGVTGHALRERGVL
jgi:hypothetical protein